MRQLLPYFFSLSLILQGTVVFAQTDIDSLAVKEAIHSHDSTAQSSTITENNKEAMADSLRFVKIKKKQSVGGDTIQYPLISALSVSFDYPKLISFVTPFEQKVDAGVQLQIFRHILVVAEFGKGRIRPRNFYKNVNYEVNGTYARLGAGYTKTLGAKSRLNIGFNYALGYFKDKGNIKIESPSGLFDSFSKPFDRESLKADWFELTFGSERVFIKNLYLGFVARLRILKQYDSFEDIDVFAIPGYGRTFDKTIPALNLYVKYRIQRY